MECYMAEGEGLWQPELEESVFHRELRCWIGQENSTRRHSTTSMTSQDQLRLAYRLRLETHNFTGEAKATLYVVECEFCDRRCGGYADFPLVLAKHFRDCSWKLQLGRHAPTMSWSSFQEVIRRGRRIYHDDSLELVPNSSLGPIAVEPIGRKPAVLKEIDVASPGGPLFGAELLEKLRQRAVDLPYYPVAVEGAHGQRRTYGILQPHVYRMVHPRTFEENPAYTQCEHCGQVFALNPMVRPPSRLCLQGRFRGKTDPLFRVLGYVGFVFVSDMLKDILDEIKPSGLEYDAFGVWVD